MVKGIYITNPIGRTGNHIITAIHSIYLCKKFNLEWIVFDNNFKSFDKVLNVKSKTMYNIENTPEPLLINEFKELSGYMVFHLSSYLNDEKISLKEYQTIYQEYYHLLSSVANAKPFEYTSYFDLTNKKLISSENNLLTEENTLFTHLKFTDNLLLNLNVKYNVYPISIYLYLMNQFKFNNLVVATDNPNCFYIEELKKILESNNKRLIIEHNSIEYDMEIIRQGKYILLDLSTFTWTSFLSSLKTKKVFVWEQFFTRFLKAYKNYIDITVFQDNEIYNTSDASQIMLFNLPYYIDCGEWKANEENIKLMREYQITSENFKWYNANQFEKFKQERINQMTELETSSAPTTEIELINTNNNSDIDNNIDNTQLIDTQEEPLLKTTKKIALIGPGIMSIPPKGWGAVEILIWDYYQSLTKLGWKVDIINTANDEEIINKINSANYFFVHLHYDKFYYILDYLNVDNIAFTSHYPYINNKEYHIKDGYDDIFNFMITQNEYMNFVLAEKDKEFLINHGANINKIKLMKNGASTENFYFAPECEYKNKTICLGKIIPRKRQSYLQKINALYNTNIDFVGNNKDNNFNMNKSDYCGEWDKNKLYRDLTKYGNMVLLSVGEADPLVIKEALICGLGVVVSESSSSHLDTSKEFIDIIPESKILDSEYIHNVIIRNREYSVNNRQEIYDYGYENFSYDNTIKNYSSYIEELLDDINNKTIENTNHNINNTDTNKTQKETNIVLVGTGISQIPAKGWGAVEGIIWEYYTILRDMGYNIKIVNDENKNHKKMIMDINQLKPDIVHIWYDDRIDLVPFINCKKIFYTSHWGYLPQIMSKQNDPYFKNIFSQVVTNFNRLHYLVLSKEIQEVYQSFGLPNEKFNILNNGINIEKFKFNIECNKPNKCLYLAKIDYRKRQYMFQHFEFMDFAGNLADSRFNHNDSNVNYLGEWSRDQVYNNLTDYATVILLSDGEADPLTVKEAFGAGCGVVVSEFATANLDLSKPWITVIPEEKIKNWDENFIKNAINENIMSSVMYRKEIRQYAEENFDLKKIINEKYIKYLFN